MNSNFQTENNIWSQVPELTPSHTDWLTVSRNMTLTLTVRTSLEYIPYSKVSD
jgi:hypothetical protein